MQPLSPKNTDPTKNEEPAHINEQSKIQKSKDHSNMNGQKSKKKQKLRFLIFKPSGTLTSTLRFLTSDVIKASQREPLRRPCVSISPTLAKQPRSPYVGLTFPQVRRKQSSLGALMSTLRFLTSDVSRAAREPLHRPYVSLRPM